jgi:hypothetical protein
MSAAKLRRSGQYIAEHGNGQCGLHFDDSGNAPLKVPGFGMGVPVELPPTKGFAHGFNDWAQDRLTATELSMLDLMNEITDIPNWHEHVFDQDKVAQWRSLALKL